MFFPIHRFVPPNPNSQCQLFFPSISPKNHFFLSLIQNHFYSILGIMFSRTDLGLPRTQSVLSISPISNDVGGFSRPRMLLTRSYSVPDMTANVRTSDTFKPTWSSYFYPYAYSSYMHSYPVQYYKPLYSISDPDRYYHYFSPYYHQPYRRYYLYSDYVNHHWQYPFTYYDRFKNFWQNYDSYYPRSNYYHRRQDDGGSCMNVDSIVELGFCIGSLLPAAKSEDEEKGGNEKVDLKIRTDRAPDVIIRSNGTIALEFSAFLDFFAHSTGKLITTFHVDLVLNVNVQIEGDDHVKATLEIAKINVRDVGGKSGMDQDGLDTLINLMSEKILECANSLVEKGCKIEIPEGLGGLPLNLSNLKIGFVEHALHLQTNFKLSEDSDVLGGTEPCTTMRMRTIMRRKANNKT